MWSTVWLLWLLSAAGRSGHLHLPGNLDLDLEGREDTLSGTFDCNGRTYGYYGDPASNCQVFHICDPEEDEAGNIVRYSKFSFLCGEGTVFDQAGLVCTGQEEAFPCLESETLYGAVEFGRLDDY